jgi:protein SCO1/2
MTTQALKAQNPIEEKVKYFVTKWWFWAIFMSLSFGYPVIRSMNRTLPPELPRYYKVPDFKLTNQNGQPFGSKNLQGKIYIANFMFTSCPTVCPGLMKKTKEIQTRMRGLGTTIALVSFSVDPETDQPVVLKKYHKEIGANVHIWSFLTGDHQSLRSIVVDGFKVPMGELEKVEGKVVQTSPDQDLSDVTLFDIAHTEKLVLVDAQGFVRGYYGTDRVSVDNMMIDIGLMINRPQMEKKKES